MDDDGRPNSCFVRRFGLLFESFRPPSDATLVRLSVAQARGSYFNGDSPNEQSGNKSKRRQLKKQASSQRLPEAVGRTEQVVCEREGSLASSGSVLRALSRMLRTCHVAAVLTKRLIFGGLLGAAGRRAAGDPPSLPQLWALLLTSAAFFAWLFVGKPHVSRGVQGVELLTALLELLTLCMALQSGRTELKVSRAPTGGGQTEKTMRALGTAMLVFQLLAIAVQTGYQWWAVLAELRARWGVWARQRQRRRVAEKVVFGPLGAETAKSKRKGGHGRVQTNVRWDEKARTTSLGNGDVTRARRGARLKHRRAVRMATSPPPTSTRSRERKGGNQGLQPGGLTHRVPRGEAGAGREPRFGSEGTTRESHNRRGAVRIRAQLDLRVQSDGADMDGVRKWADGLDEALTRGPFEREGAYWEAARIREWAGQSSEDPFVNKGDVRAVRFEEAEWPEDTTGGSRGLSEDSGGDDGTPSVFRFSSEAALPSNPAGLHSHKPASKYTHPRISEKRADKLVRLKSRRQERGKSSLTVFVVSEAESDESEKITTAIVTSRPVVRENDLSAFTF